MAITIPFYDSQVGLTTESPGAPAPLTSVEQAGVPGLQVARAGSQVSNIAADAARHFNIAREVARDADDLAKMNLKMHLDTNKLGNDLQLEVGAPDTWAGRFEEGAEKIRQEALALSSSPRAQANFNKAWSTIYPAKLQEVTAKGRIQESKNLAANLGERVPQYADLYNQAGDDLGRAHIKNTVDSYIDQAVSAGILNPEKGMLVKQNFIPLAMQKRVLADITADAPGTLAKLANAKENYPGLDDQAVMQLQGTAQTQMHRLQNDNAVKVQQAFDAKQLTPDALKGMLDGRTISLGTYRTFDADLQAPEGRRDPDVYASMWIKANNGKLPDEAIYPVLQSGKILVSEAQNLQRTQAAATSSQTPDDLAFTKNPYFRVALQDIERRLKPLDTSMQEGALRAGGKAAVRKDPLPSLDAARKLMEACQQAQSQGQLTNQFIQDKSREIMAPYVLMGAQEAIKKPTLWQRMVGETPANQPPPPGGAMPGSQGAPLAGSRPVLNRRTGRTEYVTEQEYQMIMRAGGGAQ